MYHPNRQTSQDVSRGLMPLLQRLDRLLERAITAARLAYGSEATADPQRGLHIEDTEVDRLLTREPGAPAFIGYVEEEAIPPLEIWPDSRPDWLQKTFSLSDFDLDVLAIALAPELDRRYERLYAYLQDDIRCKRPSVDLALNLLAESAVERLARRVHFAPEAPLLRQGLLQLVSDPQQSESTLLARELHLSAQVVRFLLGQPGLDPHLSDFCQFSYPALPEPGYLDASLMERLVAMVNLDWQARQPLILDLQGTDSAAQRQIGEALAAHLGVPLLLVQLERLLAAKVEIVPTLNLLFREVRFQSALLLLMGTEALRTPEQFATARSFQELLVAAPGVTLLAGDKPWEPAPDLPVSPLPIAVPPPDFARRRTCWQRHLAAGGLVLPDADLDALSDRFRLTADQIAAAVTAARNTARLTHPDPPESTPRPGDLDRAILFAAARHQSGQGLGELARKIEPKYTWEDIVLPPDSLKQLREICDQAQYRHQVQEIWGFERAFSLGKGLNVLFSGASGTGKTMAAEVIAHELQLDLYKIDLSQVVSKYIGETEKNLNRIFIAAATSNAILLFDEADSLFGKRSEVRDSRDRYANLEVSYLLQQMEEYEGIAILTTNLRGNLDEAFPRRLRFIIEFPLPDRGERQRIWEQIWPEKTPRAPDLDLEFLARRFEITGANIRNVALAAAFLAAADGGTITRTHLHLALRREYQKMGKLFIEEG